MNTIGVPKNRVPLYRIDPRRTTVAVPGVYRYRRSKRIAWGWLDRLRRRVLSWLTEPYEETEIQYERTELKVDRLLDAVYEHRMNVRNYTNRSPSMIVMGPEQWREVAMESVKSDFMHYMDFRCPPEDQRLMGMRVIVAPWIDGFFVIPEDGR